jgi:hypothetical protein
MSDKWKHDNWHNHQANRQKCGEEEIKHCPWCRIAELESGLRDCRKAVKYTGSYESVTKLVDALIGDEDE